MLQSELKAKLKTSRIGGIYLFAGEEEYLKRHYLSVFREKVLTEPAFAPFNHYTGEGASPDFGALADAVLSPPMISDYKLIEWSGIDFEAMKEAELERLEALAATVTEYPYAVVILRTTNAGLNTGTAKRPTALYRRLSAVMNAVNFETPGDAQLLTWLHSHLAHEGISPSGGAERMMIDRVGHSMDALAGEVEKISCYCSANNLHDLTPELTVKLTVSSAEDDAFGLSNAILASDAKLAYRKLHDLKRRRVEPMIILSQLSRLYADLASVSLLLAEGGSLKTVTEALSMNEYKAGLYVKGARARKTADLLYALDRCREIDLLAKRGGDPMPMLDRLVGELL